MPNLKPCDEFVVEIIATHGWPDDTPAVGMKTVSDWTNHAADHGPENRTEQCGPEREHP
jgi:hypothetical protein